LTSFLGKKRGFDFGCFYIVVADSSRHAGPRCLLLLVFVETSCLLRHPVECPILKSTLLIILSGKVLLGVNVLFDCVDE
jgi:hypothetical protein